MFVTGEAEGVCREGTALGARVVAVPGAFLRAGLMPQVDLSKNWRPVFLSTFSAQMESFG